MKTSEIRQKFLNYFVANNHRQVSSSPVIGPSNDPTVLWTNSGMIQFKDVFVGREERPYRRATSSQKCLRAGGKHNDLDQVGFTARHHTFFEMLGNFSFGDYFKQEAIHFAWDFLTGSTQEGKLGLPAKDLWVTVFGGEDGVPADEEAIILWTQVGVPPERILKFGKKDNFWQMGDTGPCGPCSEIHFDRGASYPGDDRPNGEGDRVMEIWNLVFMQYNRNDQGALAPLPKPSIDTGMGLERVASVLQKKDSNYDIDLFVPIFKAIWSMSTLPTSERQDPTAKIASQVIADHIRAATFMIADGVIPSNEGRGYVLRKIIRRALRFGKRLGMPSGFFAQLPSSVLQSMQDAYPELSTEIKNIEGVLTRESKQFEQTLLAGLKILESAKLAQKTLSGSDIFKLYDTYGFPLDLVEDWCRERQVHPDLEGFQKELAEQRAKSKVGAKTAVTSKQDLSALMKVAPTTFTGYEHLQENTKVLALLDAKGQGVSSLTGEGSLLVDSTPFYAQGGGQVGDTGTLKFEGGYGTITDTQSPADKRIVHQVHIEGTLKIGDEVHLQVHAERRARIRAHHTATHLLHAALREVLGPHVKQAGSVVDEDRLRFDFTHYAPLDREQIELIESSMNEQSLKGLPACIEEQPIEEALQQGAMALFGEKYGERVRVLTLGDYSVELCGGTHVANTGEIGLIKITQESSVASGIRRVEAVAGVMALKYLQDHDRVLSQLARNSNVSKDQLPSVIANKDQKIQALEQELKKTKLQAASSQEAEDTLTPIKGGTLVFRQVEGVEGQDLRQLMDRFRQRHPQGILLLVSLIDSNQLALVISVSSELPHHAGDLLKIMTPLLNGKGGGKKDLAQGGGTEPSKLLEALEVLKRSLL